MVAEGPAASGLRCDDTVAEVLGFRALVQRFLRAADRRAGGAAAVSVGARMVDTRR